MSKTHSPKHDNLQAAHELEQHEVKQVLNFLKHYGKLIGIGLLVAVVTILASRGFARQKTEKLAQAEELLASALSPQQLEEVVDRYGSTPAAPVALLNLAKNYFNEGDFFQARAQYDRFLKDYKKHELRPVAEFGLASCSEADGDFDGAMALFSAFIEAHDTDYLQPLATIGLARSMEQAGHPDDARIALEDFLTENPDSRWIGQAKNRLEQLGQSTTRHVP